MVTTPNRDSVFKDLIRTVPDFPIPGIQFKDISPLLADPSALSLVLDISSEYWIGTEVDGVLAIESRGFVLGTALARSLAAGLVIVRKPGKLPGIRDSFDYTCEYCSGRLEVGQGLVQPGKHYLVVDDLLATGGTARATADYVLSKGASVAGYSFMVELPALHGRQLLDEAPVHSTIRY
jgi:adenine phosphoribosyltransferase